MEGRFADPGFKVHEFADEVLVCCPACGGYALVLARLGECEHRWAGEQEYTRRTLRCGFGYTRDEFQDCRARGGPVAPYFRLPLWLAEACCRGRRFGHTTLPTSTCWRARATSAPGCASVARSRAR